MALSNLQLTREFVQAVRDAADIVDVASAYTRLQRAGRKWKGLCPLHKEKTPSFHVDPDLGFFKCFGCGQGGDAIKLHMLLSGDDFAAAMESLARRFGVPMPAPAAARGSRHGGPGEEAERDLEAVLEAAATWFRERLVAVPEARRYLERRQIPAALVERYGIGFAPEGWRNLIGALHPRIPLGDLLDVGLVARPEGGGEPYDRFRNRLIFPIRNASGRLVGFGGRALGDDPAKYLNTAETGRFHKGALLYGLDQAKRTMRERRRAFLVEGYVDALAAVAAGIEESVASMGTALTPEQAKLLARFADEVVLGYDGDPAGETACRRALPILLAAGLAVRRARLPDGHDPDSLRRERGEAALRAAVEEAEDLVLAEIDRLAPADIHRNPHGRAKAARATTDLLAAVPDPIVRFGYAQLAAQRLGVPQALLLSRLGLGRETLARAVQGEPARTPGHGRERQALRLLFQMLARGEKVTLPELPPPAEAFLDPILREFFRAFLGLYEERGGAPGVREIEERVEGVADAGAAMADLLVESDDSRQLGDPGEALRDLRFRWAKERRNELSRLIVEAGRRNDVARQEELLREKEQLRRELFPSAPNAG
jgi:DNA primase